MKPRSAAGQRDAARVRIEKNSRNGQCLFFMGIPLKEFWMLDVGCWMLDVGVELRLPRRCAPRNDVGRGEAGIAVSLTLFAPCNGSLFSRA